jgi:hypothetical protein
LFFACWPLIPIRLVVAALYLSTLSREVLTYDCTGHHCKVLEAIGGAIPYMFEGEGHHYHPDMRHVPTGLVIEVKSWKFLAWHMAKVRHAKIIKGLARVVGLLLITHMQRLEQPARP